MSTDSCWATATPIWQRRYISVRLGGRRYRADGQRWASAPVPCCSTCVRPADDLVPGRKRSGDATGHGDSRESLACMSIYQLAITDGPLRPALQAAAVRHRVCFDTKEGCIEAHLETCQHLCNRTVGVAIREHITSTPYQGIVRRHVRAGASYRHARSRQRPINFKVGCCPSVAARPTTRS